MPRKISREKVKTDYKKRKDTTDMNSKHKKRINNYWRLILFIIVIIGIPFFLDKFIFGNNVLTTMQNEDWAAFLGGYLGGVTTLIALYVTIIIDKRNSIQKEEEEKEKLVNRSALIVYYDFTFAKDDLKFAMKSFFRERKNKSYLNMIENDEIQVFHKNIVKMKQFYFDKNWIQNVAVLYQNDNFKNEDIKQIYAFYGHLSNIENAIECDDIEINRRAFSSMSSILNCSFILKDPENKDFDINSNYAYIYNKLEEISLKSSES